MPPDTAADASRRDSGVASRSSPPAAASSHEASRSPDKLSGDGDTGRAAPDGGRAVRTEQGADAAATATSTSPRTSSPPSKKARTTKSGSTGSRGVANLTSEQLAKKRANDREAQRAIRERTRHQIESLEQRIEELTSQQPYQELQTAIKQKELVEAENAEIKRRMQAILGIVQPLLDGSGLSALGSSPLEDPRPDFARASMAPASVYAPNCGPPADPYSPSSATTGGVSVASRTYSTPWSMGMPPTSEAAASMPPQPGIRHAPLSHLLTTSSADRAGPAYAPFTGRPHAGLVISPNSSAHLSEPMHQDGRRISLPSDSHITLSTSPHVPDDGPSPSSTHNPPPASPASYSAVHRGHEGGYHPAHQQPPRTEPMPSSYNTLPLHVAATCTLDGILLDFVAERRRAAATPGISELDLLGPHYPDFTYFMLPSSIRKQRRAQHPLSQLLTDVILTFPDIRASPDKVATYYGMYTALQWMVQPSQALYERMLPQVRPTAWQLATPHPVWIDFLPWPAMRDALVKNYTRILFDEFFVPFTKTISVNWSYSDEAVFRNGSVPLPHPDRPTEPLSQLELTTRFEEHMRDIRNWSVGSTFVAVYPELAPAGVRVEDKREDA